jgi:starvation-inducible DNA-binding protein
MRNGSKTKTKTDLAVSTKNDLPEETRAKIVRMCNETVADLLDLQLQSKQAHWNVRGPRFYQLHLLFDQVHGVVEDLTDTVAERASQLGGIVEGTVQAIAERSQLPAYPLEITEGLAHVEALSAAIAAAGQRAREAIDQADELGDKDSADVFTAVSRGLDKQLWFVEAHLQADQ